MGIGTALFLIAVGAILRFAVTAHAHGFSIHTVGTILIVVGIAGLVISLLYTAMWTRRGDRTRVVRDRGVVRDRDVY